ncbi:MAG: hypothetical protein R3C60_12935 [Parvularculaceae bacterium]
MRRYLIPVLFALVGACASAPSTPASPAGENLLSFIVIGDTPYTAADVAMLKKAIPAIKEEAPDFVIHVGDTKSGGKPCDGSENADLGAMMIALAPSVFFYTPGDNEWTDCDRFNDPATGRKMSELGRLAVLKQEFFSAPPPKDAPLGAEEQSGFPFNRTWTDKSVRLATVFVSGTDNGRSAVEGDPLGDAAAEADRREKADVQWIDEVAAKASDEKARALIFAMQADINQVAPEYAGVPCVGASAGDIECDAYLSIRNALRIAAESFDGPVLIIHGDTTPFTLDRHLLGGGADNLWRLNAAGDALGANPVSDVTKVTVTDDVNRPFRAVGLVTGASPR